jgi:hypothetical protein
MGGRDGPVISSWVRIVGKSEIYRKGVSGWRYVTWKA